MFGGCVLIIAHRGASGCFPENTLLAFEEAIRAGADMCELDVQSTRDGELVVIHDDTVDRTTDGHGDVRAMTLCELKQLRVDAKLGPQSVDQRIPTLREVLDLVRGRCRLNIEIKAGGVESTLCALIRTYDPGAVLVSSFDWQALARVREIAPEIALGLLANRSPAQLLAAASKMDANAINPRRDMVTEALCLAAHGRALKVYAWTVDEPSMMTKLIADGIDGIMTNYPERLRRLLAS